MKNGILTVLLIELVITFLMLLPPADLLDFLILSLWVGLPLILATTSAILERLGKPHSTTLPISGAVLGIVAIFLYADAIFRPDAQSGLVFLVIPFYQLVIMLAVIFIAAIRKNRQL